MELIYTLDDVDKVAKQLIQNARTKTLLFYGNMGVGKTTFINSLLKAMGSNDIATSPTFSIVNEYFITDDTIYHFYFYRIESIAEAYDIGIEDYLYSGNWVFIEWPSRIAQILPKHTNTITIIPNTNVNKRNITLCS